MLFKNIGAVVLLIVYLLSATATSEFLKIPLLVHHYYDHKDENRNITLIEFLSLHYYTEDGTDKDAMEDNQLPFKSCENASTVSFISLTPPPSIELVAEFEKKSCTTFGVSNPLLPPSGFMATIWQPPRCC